MPMRWGPGPVFHYEAMAVSRRWQNFALRSLAVLVLLAGLTLVWISISPDTHKKVAAGSIHDVAAIGTSFYQAIAMVQISLVLLAAPAATAGAICLDRSRGTLTHMLVTDLSDAEIVLGKLFARLGPVLALVGASLPVLSITTMLGGVALDEIVWLTVVSLATAAFGCALALAVSVRARKTHEVLMAVYSVWGVVMLSPLVWMLFSEVTSLIRYPPGWLWLLNPYYLVLAGGETVEIVVTVAAMLVLTAALIGYSIWRLRGEVTGRTKKTRTSWRDRLHSKRLASWRVPSLDDNPVLWREWQHSRPSRMTRIVWGLLLAPCLLGTGLSIAAIVHGDIDEGIELILMINGLAAGLGLLLVSLGAPTALAEERVRGSLDVLLATPLSTASIVWGKWWAFYRVVPRLALLPIGGLLAIVVASENFRRSMRLSPLSIGDGIAIVVLPVAWVLVQGAVITSFGLLMATWMSRVGRALALSVSVYVAVTFGGFILHEIDSIAMVAGWLGYEKPRDELTIRIFEVGFGSLNPIYAQVAPLMIHLDLGEKLPRGWAWGIEVAGLLTTAAVAAALYGLTVLSFERCLGRVSERPHEPRNRAKPRLERLRASPGRVHEMHLG